MTAWRRLSSLLSDGRPAADIVALRRDSLLPFHRFQTDVAAAAERFRGCRRAALTCQDGYLFAVGLFGLFHAGAGVALPGNALPGTLERLSGEWDRVIDDACLADLAGAAPELPPLDAERISITLFTSGSTGRPKAVVRTLAMLEREIIALDRRWGGEMGRGSVFATVAPQHLYGLTFQLLWPLAAGRPFAADRYDLWEILLADLPAGATLISSPAHLSRLDGIAPLADNRRPAAIILRRSAAFPPGGLSKQGHFGSPSHRNFRQHGNRRLRDPSAMDRNRGLEPAARQ